MAWTDEPSDAQINALYRWMSWKIPNQQAIDAVHWLKEHATRKEVSTEMTRVRDLYYKHKLDSESCFSSSIWEGFKME